MSAFTQANQTSQASISVSPTCDLCHSAEIGFVLTTNRLDGPLVRCLNCGLYFVIKPQAEARDDQVQSDELSESQQASTEMQRLAVRARELELVEPDVEESEGYWRKLTAQDRLNDLLRMIGVKQAQSIHEKRLLEIGCSTGDFLSIAQKTFTVSGVEADAASCAISRSRGIECFNGTLSDAKFPSEKFDVIVLYHVIEHLPSPTQTLQEIQRILKPGGWLVIEAPNINNIWFRLLGARWRQFIPDHLFFFDPQTIKLACEQSGLHIRENGSVGKAMSLRLFISRVGRYNRAFSRTLMAVSNHLGLSERTVHLNLGDVMRVYATKQ
ncbi:MAG TPA: class I SAM-dependent methyltransferase [Blastocatellia bacterium]|nr:class I SAM-dependent methyltransferase [Blastocatellia bacterium]